MATQTRIVCSEVWGGNRVTEAVLVLLSRANIAGGLFPKRTRHD